MAKSLAEFALFGGAPMFKDPLHVGRPNIGNRTRLRERIDEMLDRRWLSNNGPFVQEFEKKISAHCGVKNVICVCNATIGLEIAIRALGLTGEVIVPANTFVATAHSLQWQEITPVFADIVRSSHNIDPARIESLITPKTTGILATHLWGRPCDVNAIAEVANKHSLKLVFDAAHAFGCSLNGKMIGSFGNAEVFSFHATKFLNSFEGGAICTDDDSLAKRIRLMTNFGFAGFDNVVDIGTNGKMTEVCAVMGITSLEALPDLVDKNRINWEIYRAELDGLRGVALNEYNPSDTPNYQYVVLEVDEKLGGVPRDWIIEALCAENVLARRYFYPGVHRMEPYRSHFPHARLLLPNTEDLVSKLVILPTGMSVGKPEIASICGIIRSALATPGEFMDRSSKISRRFTPNLH